MSIANNGVDVHPKDIAQEVLGIIKWVEDDKGYCRCPGHDQHGSKSGNTDCIVYLNGAANIFCFHDSCVEERQQASKALRSALAKGEADPSVKLSRKELSDHHRQEQKRRLLETRAATSLPLILKRYPWPLTEISENSPVTLNPGDVATGWKHIVGLYKADDILWIGDTYSSGKPEHHVNFKRAEEWLQQPSIKGQLTCPATFKNDSHSRSNDNVLTRRFLVVESDVLTKDQAGAIFRWLKEEVGLNLRAVVDTAGKSLHGWFEFPKKAVFDELQIILPQLGCDPGLFRASQPCRIPGVLRGDKYQSLIYLSGKEGK
jgi:hypothetical protein